MATGFDARAYLPRELYEAITDDEALQAMDAERGKEPELT